MNGSPRTRKGRNGAWTARGKDGREEMSGGEIERGREREGEQGREGNFKGGILRRVLASVLYSIPVIHK